MKYILVTQAAEAAPPARHDLTLAGLAAGVVVALALTRLMSALLFEIRPADPAALGGATLLLAAVAALDTYIPARRATKVDPISLLRYE